MPQNGKIKRRTFHKYTLGALSLSLPKIEWPQFHTTRLLKTDTHVHLFNLGQFQYGWLKNAPEINRSFGIPDFMKATQRCNIGKIIFMESGADRGYGVDEARWVSKLAQAESRICGIIAKLNLDQDEDPLKSIKKFDGIPLLKGFRGNFPSTGRDDQNFVEALQILGERNLTFDLLLRPPQFSKALEVIKTCPSTRFILDHIGNPDLMQSDNQEWYDGIKMLAELPNLNCKISGVITRAGKGWTIPTIEPFVLHAMEQFGPDRIVYGGDWPVVLRAGTYRQWSRAFEKLTSSFNTEEKAKIYNQNADRIYRL